MSIFKKQKSQTSTTYPTIATYTTTTPGTVSYGTVASGCTSSYINTGGFATISSSGIWGTSKYKSYIDPNSYIKTKLKDGTEVEITLKDYVGYPLRMGKELEDSTLEEFNEWKTVSEI